MSGLINRPTSRIVKGGKMKITPNSLDAVMDTPEGRSKICVCDECDFLGVIPVPRRSDDEDADSDFVFCPKCGSPICINE